MANCATCHEGKLDMVLTDANFVAATCKSCHAVDGSDTYGTSAVALNTIMPAGHNRSMSCAGCHNSDGTAPEFKDIHPGYDATIYATNTGVKYSDWFKTSIDSYVHATHSFQAFDSDDVDMTDPVEKMRYEHHVEHTCPNFTIKSCESCHNAGTYQIPDQSKSLPGILSKSFTWDTDRNIGVVPSFVSGPGARACGGCHRAHYINEDDAGGLAALNQHMKSQGYLVETVDGIFDMIVMNVMSLF